MKNCHSKRRGGESINEPGMILVIVVLGYIPLAHLVLGVGVLPLVRRDTARPSSGQASRVGRVGIPTQGVSAGRATTRAPRSREASAGFPPPPPSPHSHAPPARRAGSE